MTQERLARELEVTLGTYASWEGGKTVPRRKMQEKLAAYFGLPVELLELPEPVSVALYKKRPVHRPKRSES